MSGTDWGSPADQGAATYPKEVRQLVRQASHKAPDGQLLEGDLTDQGLEGLLPVLVRLLQLLSQDWWMMMMVTVGRLLRRGG